MNYNTYQKSRGFTLVEIMIVVVIIGLLAAMAIPAFKKVQESSRASRIAKDMKTIGDSFNIIILDEGIITAGIYNENGAGSDPGGFAVRDVPALYNNPPLGDNSSYSYDYGTGYSPPGSGGVILSDGDEISDSLMTQIDEILDDGDIATGLVTKVNNNQLFYISCTNN